MDKPTSVSEKLREHLKTAPLEPLTPREREILKANKEGTARGVPFFTLEQAREKLKQR